MTYLEKFRKVEAKLRPRGNFKHEEAVELLATVVHEADEHIAQLEEENSTYIGWLVVATLTVILLGVATLL